MFTEELYSLISMTHFCIWPEIERFSDWSNLITWAQAWFLNASVWLPRFLFFNSWIFIFFWSHSCLLLCKSLLQWLHTEHLTLHWLKFLEDKLLRTGGSCCCNARNSIQATWCSFEVKSYCEDFDKALCSSFEEFDCDKMWSTFLIPGELKKYAFRGSNNWSAGAPPDKC